MPFAGVGGTSVRDSQYLIDNSLRFNSADSADLTFTLGTPTSQQKFTESFWLKRGLTGGQRLFKGAGTANTDKLYYGFNSDQLNLTNTESGGTNNLFLKPNAYYRDYGAWYHVVLSVDTTQATSSDRAKLYVNGEQVTDFATALYPPLNHNFVYYASGTQIQIGDGYHATAFFYDGYMAEINFVDGQALSPTDFGEFDADSGIWKPIKYTGTYGNNGYYLKFNNTGNLGEDSSGNDNTWTPTNLSGTTDVTTDTPTNNFCTLNAVDKDGHTNSEGNLKVSGDVVYGMQKATQGVTTGKWYFEARLNVYQNDTAVGLANENENTYTRFTGETTNSVGYLSDGRFFYNSSATTYSSASGGNIFQVAFDADNGKIWVGINNTWQNSGNPSAGTNELQTVSWNTFIPVARTVTTGELIFNFGQEGSFAGTATAQGNTDANGYGNFYYEPPTGFLALCTQNLATELSPTIDDGSQYFNTVLYTGNGTNPRSLTGVGFQPDFTWIKNRTDTWGHGLADSTRGGGKTLITNANAVEQTNYTWGYVDSFDSDGFTVDAGASGDDFVNQTSDNYVSWNWLANGGTTSSNTDGSITSTVQANTTAGFSIVTYTGNQTNGATVGHGLGNAPKMVIVKELNGTSGWIVKHPGLTDAGYYLILNATDAQSTAANVWNDTDPSSTVFTLGDNTSVNENTLNYVAYCFAEIEGYSKFGSYTGNGSSDGTFVYTGFRPAIVIQKSTTQVSNWITYDNKRPEYNVQNKPLYPNLNNAEGTSTGYDFVSNGFKLRTSGGLNSSGHTYIYMAFAENPFVTSGATPVTAR